MVVAGRLAPLPASRPDHRRRRFYRTLARDFAIIITTWAASAYPILWLCSHVLGPALIGDQR